MSEWRRQMEMHGVRVIAATTNGDDGDTLTVATLPAFLARFNPKWNVPDIAYRLHRSRNKNPIPCQPINGELIFSKEKIRQWIKGEKDVSQKTWKR